MHTESIRIGITTRIVDSNHYHDPRDALSHEWANFINASLPNTPWLAIPNLGMNAVTDYCNTWKINRLILSGGDDIGETPLRDESEFSLLEWASENCIPTFGVCRGMQIMGVHTGGKLNSVDNHIATEHTVHGQLNATTNSYHRFGFIKLPPDFIILAQSNDGVIEAMKHQHLPWVGCMWHPERESTPQPHDIKLIRELFL